MIAISAALYLSYQSKGVVYVISSGEYSAAERIEYLKESFIAFGPFAPVLYVSLVTLEVVVAPIPGLILYAPGGVIFGGFWGGLLSLIGNVVGAGIAHQIGRWLGRTTVAKFVENKSLDEYTAKISNHGVWVIFLLRVNPITSSDLVSYAAGLIGMPVWKLMLGTLLGMAPLCWIQSYCCDEIFHICPQIFYGFLVLCIAYACGIIWFVKGALQKSEPSL